MNAPLQKCLQASLLPFALSWMACAVLATTLATGASAQTGAFEIHFDASEFGTESGGSFTGDVFVAFGKGEQPREEMHAWFSAPPVLRFHVVEAKPKDVLRFNIQDAVAFHPTDLGTQEAQAWTVQAIARLSKTGREAGLGPGDVISVAQEIEYLATGAESTVLHLNEVVKDRDFKETERMRLFEFKSPALSKHHGFDYTLQAGVLLPKDFDAKRTYPVVYSVTGFGGTHRGIGRWKQSMQEGSPLEQCIVVVPDANNRYGHSVFCDSPTNGPWGHALVHELIPALEAKFRGAGATQRYVTGISSGGWSSLWLQVTYPEHFAGCWSHVPDPIDFNDFQQINLYEPAEGTKARNMYIDEEGQPRPVARKAGGVMLTYQEFAQREHVLNPGGQIRSFESTFSPRLSDGTPRRIFNIETGTIDHETAKAWKPYDISHTLLTRWSELRPALAGKIHIYAGEVDTFYLEGAVIRFQSLAAKKGMLEDMVVEVVPGMNHTQHQAGFDDMVRTIEETMSASVGD